MDVLWTGFLRRPWIQGQPWKVLKFHKTENVFELFWKTSGRSWKVWNLPMWNFQQDLVTWWLWELPAIVAIKRVEELLRLLIINKRHARMLQISVFFSQSTSRVVCYRMIYWKKALNYWMKRPWKALKFFRSSGAGTRVKLMDKLPCTELRQQLGTEDTAKVVQRNRAQ